MRDGYLRGALSPQATQRQMDVLAAYVAATPFSVRDDRPGFTVPMSRIRGVGVPPANEATLRLPRRRVRRTIAGVGGLIVGYWVGSLGLIAFGVIAMFSIGRPFLLVGLAMLILGPLRSRPSCSGLRSWR